MGNVTDENHEVRAGESMETIQSEEDSRVSSLSPSHGNFYSNPAVSQNWSDSDDRSSEDGSSEGVSCGADAPFLQYSDPTASEALEEPNYIYYEPSHSYEVNHSYVAPSLEPIPENQVWSTSEETPAAKDVRAQTTTDFYAAVDSISASQQSSPLPALLQSFTFEAHVGDKCADKRSHTKEDLQEAELNFPLLSPRDVEIAKEDNADHTNAGSTPHAPPDVDNGQEVKTSEPLDSSIPCSTGLGTFLSNSVIPNFHQANFKSAVPNFPALDHSGTFHWKTLSEKGGRILPRNLTQSEVRCSLYSRRHSCKGEEDPIDEDHHINNGDANKCSSVDKRVAKCHPDVDKGYAWVVALCVLISFGVLQGLLFTCSLYYTEMLHEFGKSRSYTAWMGSLVNGFFLLGSIGSSALIQKFSCRIATILGSLLMTAGYIASAFAPSLEVVFVTFGIITASGMNLAFSSAILVLAQYFDKQHCLATTIAMLGNGIGVLILSQVMERVIEAYGWRLSFFACAAISLQLCVVGAFFFPLPPSALQQHDFEEDELEGDVHDAARRSSEDESSSSEDEEAKRSSRRLERKHGRAHRRHNNLFYRKGLLDKSFSSLVLCPQAGYLSHSLASLEPSSPSTPCAPRHHIADCEAAEFGRQCRRRRSRRRQLHDADLRRNESLASRDSSFLPAFFRRSQLSFSSKLSSAQISLAGIQSSHQSRISLKDSRLDLMFHGLKSNPHSFSLRVPTSSQLEETEQLCAKLDDLLEEKSSSEDGSKEKLSEPDARQCSLQITCEKGKDFCYTNQLETVKPNSEASTGPNGDQAEKGIEKKASFLISGGESDDDDDDDASCTSDVKSQNGDHDTFVSKFSRSLHCWKMPFCSARPSINPIFKDPRVWCFALSYFCGQLGTTTIYVIFADFAQYLNVGSYASTAMSAAGIGDIIGRFGGGMLAVGRIGNSTLLYASFMLVSAMLLCSYLFVSNGIVFVGVTAVYGVMYGAQNMYFAITAKIVFGRQSLADVFGLAVFLGGIGSLVGSPLAGLLIDVSGGYISVLLSEVACCVLGSMFMFICYLSTRNKCQDELSQTDGRNSSETLVPSNGRPLKPCDGGVDLNCTYIPARETSKRRRGSFTSRDFSSHRSRCASFVSAQLMSNSSSRSSVADDEVHVKIPTSVNRGRGHSKNFGDSGGSLASLPTRAFLHHPSHRSHALRSTNSLKRTSTCDSILNRVPIHSPVPASNTSEGSRRFTMSSPRQYNPKKKSPSLYEEVLGRAYAQNHNVCYSDHDLS